MVRVLLASLLILSGCASIPKWSDDPQDCTIPKIVDVVTAVQKVFERKYICIDQPEAVDLPSYVKLLQLPPAEEKPIVAVYQFLDKTGQRKARDLLSINEVLKSCDIGLSTVIIEKEVIKKTNTKFPQLVTKEDFVFWLMLLRKNYKFYAYDKNLTNWTDSRNSLSSSTIQKLIDGYKVYNHYMNFNMIKSLYFLICLSLNYLKKK